MIFSFKIIEESECEICYRAVNGRFKIMLQKDKKCMLWYGQISVYVTEKRIELADLYTYNGSKENLLHLFKSIIEGLRR